MNVLYTAVATATGGRDGRAVSSDKILDVKLTTPKELGGAGGEATNPEQLFAAGYSACFIGALKFVASQSKRSIPADASITAHTIKNLKASGPELPLTGAAGTLAMSLGGLALVAVGGGAMVASRRRRSVEG